MFQRGRMLYGLLAFAGVMLCMAFPARAYADNADDIFSSGNVGASLVLDTNAYNEAETENLGVSLMEAEEEFMPSLVMANVKSVLNMRKESSTDSEIVGKLYKDCGGTLLEYGEEWSLVQSGEVTGWCKNQYLYFGDEAEALAKEVGTTSAIMSEECVAIRAEADDEAAIIGYAAKDTLFEVIYDDDEWVCIAYGEYDGFVRLEYVDLDFEVDAGESIEVINERKRLERELKNSKAYKKQMIKEDGNDLKLLASIIWCEARGEPFEGMIAVGAVVMNRVNSPAYPNTIFDVIFASGQFSPVKSGGIYKAYKINANPVCYQAAQIAMDGFSNVGTVTHFRRAGKKQGLIIGHHVFY